MTFEREVMAWLCLALVWGNTGLVCAQAVSEFRQRLRLRRALRFPLPGELGLVRGALQLTGDDGPRLQVVQAARSRGDGKIYFHDRRASSTAGAFGIRGEAREVRVRPEAGRVWVWPRLRRVEAALACPSAQAFDQLLPGALHARGAERELCFGFDSGQELFVAGRLNADGTELRAGGLGQLTLVDSESSAARDFLLISEEDPRRVLGRQLALIFGVVFGILVTLGLLSALALSSPAFGTWSRVGALGLLVFLLLIQPLGVWLSERVMPPHCAPWGGLWRRSGLPTESASGTSLEPAGGKPASV